MNFVQPIRNLETIEKIKNDLKRKGLRDYLLFLLGINTGLRISDLLTLTVAEIRLAIRTSASNGYTAITEKKTGKRKDLILNSKVIEELTPYIATMSDDEFLFSSREGENKPITRQQAYNIIHNACVNAGMVGNVACHTLRKTMGYHYYRLNKDVATLQKIFNHSAPSITLRYIGIEQEQVNEALLNFSL